MFNVFPFSVQCSGIAFMTESKMIFWLCSFSSTFFSFIAANTIILCRNSECLDRCMFMLFGHRSNVTNTFFVAINMYFPRMMFGQIAAIFDTIIIIKYGFDINYDNK